MLIIKKNQVNNLIATVSMNKTLPNPYYLFSFQHIASKERVSFIPEVIVSNTRYDKFRFNETYVTDLDITPPNVYFEYLGQYYYSIYEQVSSGNTDIALAYNKLESGRAVVIQGDGSPDACFFEPYISDDEDFANVIYISDDEEECINIDVTPTPTPTPTMTSTPTNTPTTTTTATPTPSNNGGCVLYTAQTGEFALHWDYLDCDGNPQSYAIPFGDFYNFCAIQGSVVVTEGEGTITYVSACV